MQQWQRCRLLRVAHFLLPATTGKQIRLILPYCAAEAQREDFFAPKNLALLFFLFRTSVSVTTPSFFLLQTSSL